MPAPKVKNFMNFSAEMDFKNSSPPGAAVWKRGAGGPENPCCRGKTNGPMIR
jgi:hypothetical protein